MKKNIENLSIKSEQLEWRMKEAKRDSAKTMAEYDEFKKYKARTAISKRLMLLMLYKLKYQQ